MPVFSTERSSSPLNVRIRSGYSHRDRYVPRTHHHSPSPNRQREPTEDIRNEDGSCDVPDRQSPRCEKKNTCPIVQTGQYLMRCHHISVLIKNLVAIAEERATWGSVHRSIDLDEQTIVRYSNWCAAVTAFCPRLEMFLRQGDSEFVLAALKEGMRSARSADAHRLKELTGRFAAKSTSDQYVEAYDRDPADIRERVRERDERYKVIASYSPAFLYEDPDNYNSDDVLAGLMRGYFLILINVFQCCRAIFLGPRSGLHGPSTTQSPTQPGVAGIYGLLTVSVPMIVYSAVQARFALSSQQTWSAKDGLFDYEEFFETLLQVFEVSEDWTNRTLRWWNQQIFGHPNGLITLGSSQGGASDGILAKAKIQEAKRRSDKLAADRAAAGEQVRADTPLLPPEDGSSDNEMHMPQRRNTTPNPGTLSGGVDDCRGEEDSDHGGLPALQSWKRSVQQGASQHESNNDDQEELPQRQSQKRVTLPREASRFEGDNDGTDDEGLQNRRSPQQKNAKRQKMTMSVLQFETWFGINLFCDQACSDQACKCPK
ncbi:hypothetical protein EDB89DRAFT_1906001 [Lactarius sanguifluus]|nr:hypothetical protein EDB89DRAFT_1906001 [Lactarius sanguifluus]